MWENIKEMLPYIVSILGAVVSALSSVSISRKETKGEIDRLIKQHELDLETERERHKHELEREELKHKYQLEVVQKEMENKFGAEMMKEFMVEALKMPEVRNQITQNIKKTKGKR